MKERLPVFLAIFSLHFPAAETKVSVDYVQWATAPCSDRVYSLKIAPIHRGWSPINITFFTKIFSESFFCNVCINPSWNNQNCEKYGNLRTDHHTNIYEFRNDAVINIRCLQSISMHLWIRQSTLSASDETKLPSIAFFHILWTRVGESSAYSTWVQFTFSNLYQQSSKFSKITPAQNRIFTSQIIKCMRINLLSRYTKISRLFLFIVP